MVPVLFLALLQDVVVGQDTSAPATPRVNQFHADNTVLYPRKGLLKMDPPTGSRFSCHDESKFRLPPFRYDETGTDRLSGTGGYATRCPDRKQARAGGNLSIAILEARNLPNMDGYGAFGGVTDAYVKINITNSVRQSGYVRNNLNPVWKATNSHRWMNFGAKVSGTSFKVEVWDKDAFLEFGDDRVGESQTNVIFCSMLTAQTGYINNHILMSEDDVDKYEQDHNNFPGHGDSYQGPLKKYCQEDAWLPLRKEDRDQCVDVNGTEIMMETGAICIKLRQTIIPFEVSVEKQYVHADDFRKQLRVGVLGDYRSGYKPYVDEQNALDDSRNWLPRKIFGHLGSDTFGRPHDSVQTMADGTSVFSKFILGGFFIRTLVSDYNCPVTCPDIPLPDVTDLRYALLAFNMPANVTVLRHQDDRESAPDWLAEEGYNLTTGGYAVGIQLQGADQSAGRYEGWQKTFHAGVPKDHAKKIMSPPETNGVMIKQNRNGVLGEEVKAPQNMHMVVITFLQSQDADPPVCSKELDKKEFFLAFSQFGVMLLAFLGLWWPFFQRIDFRLDRVHGFLLKPEFERGESTIVAALFECYNDCPQNRDFRRNLYYATWIVYVLASVPLWILWTWGFAMISTVKPEPVGWAVVLVGTAVFLSVFALKHWQAGGWRVAKTQIKLFGLSFFLVFVFVLSVIWTDPSVTTCGRDLDFFSLTAVFIGSNTLPMIWIAFTNDVKMRKSLKQLAASVGSKKKKHVGKLQNKFKKLGSMGLKLGLAKGKAQSSRGQAPRSIFDDVLGECYTVTEAQKTFHFADVMSNAFSNRAERRARNNVRYYGVALAFLMIYIVLSFAYTPDKGALALVISIVILVLDSCIILLRRGNLTWSPGYITLLMFAARACLVVASTSDYWLLGVSLVLMVFGVATSYEIVQKRLKELTDREAGGIAFFGYGLEAVGLNDTSTSPEFVLGYLSFLFVSLLMVAQFSDSDTLPLPTMDVVGQSWSVTVFGVIAFCLMLVVGLAECTQRAFNLLEAGLLPRKAAAVYLFHPMFKLPWILASAAEFMLVVSGALVWAWTGSVFVLVTSFFAPILAGLGMYVFTKWRDNDHRLVVWPPEDEEEEEEEEDMDDEVDMLSGEAEMFSLPPLSKGGQVGALPTLKMPSLPLKSSIRKKEESESLLPTTVADASDAPAAEDGGDGGSGKKARVFIRGRTPWEQKYYVTAFAIRLVEYIIWRAEHAIPVLYNLFAWLWAKFTSIKVVKRCIVRVQPCTDKILHHHAHVKKSVAKAKAKAKKSKFDKLKKKKYQKIAVDNADDAEEAAKQAGADQVKADAEAEDEAALEGAEEDEELVDLEEMSMLQAFCEGFLLPDEYAALTSFFVLILLIAAYGNIVALACGPAFMGHVMWIGTLILIFSICPTIKYFNCYRYTSDMRASYLFSLALLWLTVLGLFSGPLEGDMNNILTLWIFSGAILYPAFIVLFKVLYKWKDDDWELSPFVVYNFPWAYGLCGLWVFEMWVWNGPYVGFVLLIGYSGILLVLFFLRGWILNDFYMPPVYEHRAMELMVGSASASVAVGLVFGVSLFYTFSLAFTFIIAKLLLNFLGREITRPPGCPIFFSPFIFPVYSYDPHDDKLHSESEQYANLYGALATALAWGIFMAVFVEPISIGVGGAAFILVLMAAITADLMSITPIKMGQAARFVDSHMLKDAGDSVKEHFRERRKVFEIVCDEWLEKDKQEAAYEEELSRLQGGFGGTKNSKKKKKKANDMDLLSQMDAMFGDDEGSDDEEEEGEFGLEGIESRRCAADIAWEIEDDEWKVCFEEDADGKEVRRFDALMDFADAFADTIRGGHGPFGVIALGGYAHKAYVKLFHPKQDSLYNDDGSRKTEAEDPPLIDTRKYLVELTALDKELAFEYHEEMRCIVLFQLLIMVGAEARLHREKVLFQKFLRENRFKLMSNGINPPKNIFSSASHASININLVAIWLMSLTPEERERFHELKSNFTEEMAVRDMMIDDEDEERRQYCNEIVENRKRREEVMCRRRYQDFLARRMRREQMGIQPHGAHDEAYINAEEGLLEIESGWSCRPGKNGRPLQFYDGEFPADGSSMGNCNAAREVIHWDVSHGINMNAALFEGGTDPDDVHQGKVQTDWFLSAISVIAASGGVDDEKVDELIDRLFITKATSQTGAYAVRFYMNSQWETIIVDDYFPCLDHSLKHEEHAGAACAYTKGFAEIWVPVLEKAYAKYYGSYSAIEEGFVHLALQNLTGGDSEEIFLNKESRGAKQAKLWENMREWQRNKYLMGAGTIAADHADHEIQDSGLVFGACYVVYECRSIDGLQLVKLRNPPGDHAEWSGDWGDLSPLWTRRLKAKLGWSDEDDNTFWMSFDDFCTSFRSLYLCKHYDPERWPIQKHHAEWSKEEGTAVGLPSKHQPDCEVHKNPQFKLYIDRPTELCFTLQQVDEEGLASPEIHPVALYVCKDDNPRDLKADLVKVLDNDTVVASSGMVTREHEVKCRCTLQPAMYTVLCATYVKDMEGPFTVTIQSNDPVVFEQIWPAEETEDFADTALGRMAAKAAKKAAVLKDKAAAKANEKLEKLKEKHGEKFETLNAMGDKAKAMKNKMKDMTKDELTKEAEAKLSAEQQAAKEAHEEALANCPWVAQWDSNENKHYYYNKETGVSVWEKPQGFVEGGHDESMDAATRIQAQFRGKKSRKKTKKKEEKKNPDEEATLVDWSIEMYDEDDDEWEAGKATLYTKATNMIYSFAHDSGNEGNLKLDFNYIKLVSCDDGSSQALFDELLTKQEKFYAS